MPREPRRLSFVVHKVSPEAFDEWQGLMRSRFTIVLFASVLFTSTLSALAAAQPSAVQTPSVTVLEAQEVRGILGRDVRSTADENMGRIVDVLVDGAGSVRAAVIDFGGFLGVGSRKIAVDWKALHFVPAAGKQYAVVLELTRDQVKPAPEYKEDKPIVVLGASGNLETLP